METNFNNLIELQKFFSDENICWNYLEKLRWNEKIVCPFCGSEKYYKFKNSHTYKCADCLKKYNAKSGTIFENTKIPLSKWFVSIYIATSHKKGISSLQLSKDIGVTQKTAWFILHRIREMLREKAPQMLSGVVEIDETYVGGKEENKHALKRKDISGYTNKTMVFAILKRDGNVWTKMVKSNDGKTLKPIIYNTVGRECTVVTDGFGAYSGLNKTYNHVIVNHAQGEYAKGDYHTNTIEGFFGTLKRGIIGIYHYVSPKHLHRYCDEFSFRYNTRKSTESGRFDFSFVTCDSRLRYIDLIGKNEKQES